MFLLRLLPILCLLLAGCGFEPSVAMMPDAAPPAPSVPSRFDPARCGTITGRVTWAGPIPATPGFLYGVPRGDGNFDVKLMPNPNRPDVSEQTHAVAGAVVFLRNLDPAVAKPWDWPPVRVELADRNIRVRQGDSEPRRVGFVRRGDAVEMKSVEAAYHVLRGRGAAFFSLTFPDPEQPLKRTFDKPGRIELSSAAGYYWASADLFVADHPYFTLTDRDGRFQLDRVPAGTVEVVAWLPGWTVERKERDPETGLVVRQTYGPPAEATQPVAVEPGRTTEANATLP